MSESLSVVVTTYNHEKYLAQCLDSILAQDYSNTFKIYVGEDKSPDRTKSILQEYERKYPNRIVPLYHEVNVGGHSNFLKTLDAANSDWIAWVEGDDFWSDPKKLSKQMALLELNPNAVICFSKAQSLDQKNLGFSPGRVFGPSKHQIQKTYSRNDILAGNIIPTCTVVFKKSTVWPLPEWYSNWHLGDWTLYLKALESGPAVFLNEITAVYRVHGQGAWATIPAIQKLQRQENLVRFLISIEKSSSGRKHLYLNLFAQQMGLVVTLLRNQSFRAGIKKAVFALHSMVNAAWSLKLLKSYLSRALQLFSYLSRNKGSNVSRH